MTKLIAAAVVLLALAAGGYFWLNRPPVTPATESAAAATAPAEPQTTAPDTAVTAAAAPAPEAAPDAAAAAVDPAMLSERTLGNPDAPIKITEYASFTCPHCANFHTTVFKDLKTNYIDTGKVFFTYREVYFDRFGLWAAMVARCAPQDRYFGFVDVLYTSQGTWTEGSDPALIAENLKRIGRTAGMTDAALDACLNNAAFAEALVSNFQTNSTADDVTATPTFIVDGEKFKNMDYAAFAKLLDEKLAN